MSRKSFDPTQTPFDFLHHTLQILVVEDSLGDAQKIQNYFAASPLFHVTSASKQKDALDMLNQGMQFHVCIFSSSAVDPESDDLYLIKKYASQLPIVIIPGVNVSLPANVYRELGVKVVAPSVETLCAMDHIEFIKWSVAAMLDPAYDPEKQSHRFAVLQVLFEKTPSCVEDWSKELQINGATLRRIWQARKIRGKYALTIYRLYQTANDYQKTLHSDEGPMQLSKDIKRLIEYFLCNRTFLKPIIERTFRRS